MTTQTHYGALESMYAAAPINAIFKPDMTVAEGAATISIDVGGDYHHSAGAVHGSVYFKMLDDAAFFAANSLETEYFVLTASFTTYMTRPVVSGPIRAEGKVVNRTRTQFICEAVLYDEEDRELGRGNGIFVRGKLPLVDALGYAGKA